MYEIVFSKNIIKFLEKHKGQKIVYQLENVVELLKDHPFNNKLDITGLKGTKNIYRIRVGKYRLLYEVKNDELVIYCIDIGSRGGIYK